MNTQFDISKVPFSNFGSYFSISWISWGKAAEGLYLHTHRGSNQQVFRIDPVRNGERLAHETIATPDLLTLKVAGGGEMAFTFSGTGTVRVRGRGVSLRLEVPKERWTTAWELPGGAWAFKLSNAGVHVALERLHGTMAVEAPWETGKGFCWESRLMVAVLEPAGDGLFEAAIDEFSTTWVRSDLPAFDACRAELAHAYAAWTKGLPEVAPQHAAARDLAGYVNWSATVAPSGYLTRTTMLMSKMGMCNVYHWDNVFNAMAHCQHDPDLAWDQFMALADRADEFGKPPSNMNERAIMYHVDNPPVHGWAFRRMWNENPAMMTRARLIAAYAYLSNWTNWLTNHRTWSGDVLPFYVHGFDGGWDNSTIFDDGVPVSTPDHAAYLVLQMEALADIANALNKRVDAALWRQRSETVLAALLETLWNKDHFVGVRHPGGQMVECDSLIICMPIVLGKRLPENIRAALVARLRSHLTEWGLATEKPDSQRYMDKGYWRGPIWAPVTMLIVTGLLEIGEDALAHTIVEGFCRLCEKSGFHENFDAKTGEGCYDTAYTWTSSVFMIFASQFCNGGRHAEGEGPTSRRKVQPQ